jgi:hypothetical protein
MTISVAGRQILPGTLSEQGRLVIALIDGGRQWLDWATASPTHRYEFGDTAELVAAVQAGLHGTPISFLSDVGLQISPLKLMTMEVEDLRTLAKGQGGFAPALAAVLERHHLVSQADFALIRAFLNALGVDGEPILQARSLTDLSLLLILQREVDVTDPLTAEAVRFALSNAGSVAEFVDYLRFYLDYAKTSGHSAATPVARAAAALAAVQRLLPLAFPALDSLEVQGFPPPQQVHAAIRDWLSPSRQLGFARASRVIQQFVADGSYTGQREQEAVQLFQAFLRRTQSVLGTAEAGVARVAQDGLTYSFTLTANEDSVEVEVAAAGRVTIAGFGRLAQSKPKVGGASLTPTPKQRVQRGVSAKDPRN